MPNYDLLIAGGTVLDPANSRHEVSDIAVDSGQIVRVEPEIDRDLYEQAKLDTTRLSSPWGSL